MNWIPIPAIVQCKNQSQYNYPIHSFPNPREQKCFEKRFRREKDSALTETLKPWGNVFGMGKISILRMISCGNFRNFQIIFLFSDVTTRSPDSGNKRRYRFKSRHHYFQWSNRDFLNFVALWALLKTLYKTAINCPLHQFKPFVHDLQRVSTGPGNVKIYAFSGYIRLLNL